MNAKITIAVCMFVAAMNHASAAIVDVDTELSALATSEDFLNDYILFRETVERGKTFLEYGSFNVEADTEHALSNVTARVEPDGIGIQTEFSKMDGSAEGFTRRGTATATVNFNLSEAGVWSARPLLLSYHRSWGILQAEVSLLREGQEVYYQDCSHVLGQFFCDPDYEDEYGNIVPIPEYAGKSLQLPEGDYTLFLTATEGTSANNGGGGAFAFDLQLVPVPAALPLFLSALAAFGLVGWRRR